MNTKPFLTLIQFLVSVLACVSAAMRVEPPRIDCVVPLPEQPQAQSSATIWYDDFDGQPKPYAEGDSPLDDGMGFGGKGRSMRCLYEKGKRGIGSRKVFFGDSPTYGDKVVRRGEQFDEVYWRVYVKHRQGWRGAPAKMSRATSLTSSPLVPGDDCPRMEQSQGLADFGSGLRRSGGPRGDTEIQ